MITDALHGRMCRLLKKANSPEEIAALSYEKGHQDCCMNFREGLAEALAKGVVDEESHDTFVQIILAYEKLLESKLAAMEAVAADSPK